MDLSQHFRIGQAVHMLNGGGVIAYPTEAVWGLGCDPYDFLAVQRLLALKNRAVAKGVILVAANIEQVEPYLHGLTQAQRQPLVSSWPGPNTWLIPHNGTAPDWIRGRFDSVAIRVSAHPVVQGLCQAFGGAIVSTSANPQGKSPARQAWQVRRYFNDALDAIAPGNIGSSAKPSQIRDLLTGQVIRPQ